jgi:hypothetical protein
LPGRLHLPPNNRRFLTATNIGVEWEPFGYAKSDSTNLPEEIRHMFHYDPNEVAALI